MYKKIIFFVCLLLLISCSDERKFDYEKTDVMIGGVVVDAEIADTDEKMAHGLMERSKLGEMDGMLFIFPDEDERRFWMKNVWIPLEMIFIDSNYEIVTIRYASPCKEDPCAHYYSDPATYVLEVNMGFTAEHGIKVGDKVEIDI